MAKNKKIDEKIIGLTLMVIGVGVAFWGYQMSGALESQLSSALTGSASDGVIIRYIAGAASFIVGGYLFKFK